MKNNIGVIIYLIVIAVIILVPIGITIGITIGQYTNNEEIEITVKDKYIKNGKDNGKYLVVDEEDNTYEITDMLFKGKFNSTDIYNRLEIGKTYKVKISGHRVRFLSMYQNINEIIEEGE